MSSLTSPTFDSPHFRFENPFVYIDTTDSEVTPQPPANTENAVSLLLGDPLVDRKALMWREKLGALIVNDYLAIAPGQYKGNQKYFLARFPENYLFYVRKTRGRSHLDVYLHGAGHCFRSPNEFVFHAAWLMAGAEPGKCGCVYCDRSNPGQRGRSQSLEENRQRVRTRIRGFQAAGIRITRAPNALNRRAFLKDASTSTSERQASFGEGEGGKQDGNSEMDELDEEEGELGEHEGSEENELDEAAANSSGEEIVRLVHGYDE